MATPNRGNHNDLYELAAGWGELCRLLAQAGISVEGVFLNADAGFDAEQLRLRCRERHIEANSKSNPRNSQPSEPYPYVDEPLYQRRFVKALMQGWIVSKHC